MTMSDQIIAVLDNLCTKFGVAIDWTSENVLPYVIELAGKFIKYEIATSVITSLLLAMLAFVAYKICRYYWKKYTTEIDGYDAFYEAVTIISSVILVMITIAAIVVISCEIFDIVTCVTFPEKAIFEYIRPMIQK